MGIYRNGARGFLDGMRKACKLSRMPGFQIGLVNILGPTDAANVTALWEPLCVAVDLLVATDNWFNQNDQIDDDGAGEDEVPGA